MSDIKDKAMALRNRTLVDGARAYKAKQLITTFASVMDSLQQFVAKQSTLFG